MKSKVPFTRFQTLRCEYLRFGSVNTEKSLYLGLRGPANTHATEKQAREGHRRAVDDLRADLLFTSPDHGE